MFDTIAAAVIGARHQRAARNGQDAAATWVDGACAVAVVCDGCSSGASSEVGARLGATVFARRLGARLAAGAPVIEETFAAARGELVRVLGDMVDRLGGDREQAIREHFLFTIVAAAASGDAAAVWALGDGAFSFGGATRVLGPFADNAPPYVGYDLLDGARPVHFEVAPACTAIVIATDGATELADGLEPFAAARFVEHPDALRRQLALLARPHERIDWAEQRVVRTPAVLQDDCAVAVVRRRAS